MGKDGEPQGGVTFGGTGLHRALISLLRHVPIRAVYVFMRIFVVPVTLVLSAGARLTYRYYRQKRGWGRGKALWATYRNNCIFGETVIDKFAMYAGHRFRLQLHGFDEYDRVLQRPEAVLQLHAHIGCSEILGYSYHTGKPCNVLVFGGEKAALMAYRSHSFGDMNVRMIPVGAGEDHSTDIADALERGEVVSAFADRFFNPNKVVESTLHGHPVLLARGPFALAVTRGIDVIMLSAMKEADGSYSAYFKALTYDRSLPKKEQRRQLADAYMAEVEHLLERYPLQWFNYFDLWKEASETS